MVEQDFEDHVLLSTGKILNVSNKLQQTDSTMNDSDQVVVERVRNVWGSSSGAGSDFLDNYRKQRAVEMLRLEEMDKKWREDMENKLFHSQRIHRIKKESEKALKRKIKRDRKKKKASFSKKCNTPEDAYTINSDQLDAVDEDSTIANVEKVKSDNDNQDLSASFSHFPDDYSNIDGTVKPPNKASSFIILDHSLNDI
ncbi:hypothetical protein MACK_000965 [Theileria orientalis]|uniref:Uncharacterized protein n=1 Tax=Theileria orientalis TaxID=68886 RepID=A0A976MCZ7_THEOR|nr:hypothetical protein MACK_000965 [Theileria orientalis]